MKQKHWCHDQGAPSAAGHEPFPREWTVPDWRFCSQQEFVSWTLFPVKASEGFYHQKGEIALLPAVWWDSIDGGTGHRLEFGGPMAPSPRRRVALDSHQWLCSPTSFTFSGVLQSLCVRPQWGGRLLTYRELTSRCQTAVSLKNLGVL